MLKITEVKCHTLLLIGMLMIAGIAIAPAASASGVSPYANDNGTTNAPTQSSNTSTSAMPQSDNWTLRISDDYDHPAENKSLKDVYTQKSDDILYYKVTYHGNIETHDGFDLGIFMDVDQSAGTGLNNSTDGYYYMDGIGADYLAVVGLEGDNVFAWENQAWNESYNDFSYLDINYSANTVVAGVNRAAIDDPDKVDILVAEATYSPFDYAPDQGEGNVTVDLTNSSSEPQKTTVSLEPQNQTASIGETVQYDIMASGIDNGIKSYGFTASVGAVSTANITNVSLEGTSADDTLTSVEFSESNDSVTVSAGSAGHNDGTIGTVTLKATSTGQTDLGLSSVSIGDNDANSYNISSITNGSVTVVASPSVVGDTPAQDLDSDGTYEDVNGDGSFNIVDVSALFQNLDSNAVQESSGFDFNGDGAVNIVDVSKLFQSL